MSKALKKLGAFSVGPLVGAVLSFITVPLITFFISPEEYGKASMFSVAQSTLSVIIYLGMDQAFVREFHSYKDRIEKLLANALMPPLSMALICSLLITLFKTRVSVILFDTPTERVAVLLLAVLLPFMVVQNFALLKIRMEERGLLYSFFTILLKLLILALTLALFITFEKSFRSVVYAAALAEIINGSIMLFVILRQIRITRTTIDYALLKKMFRYGLPLIPAYATGWVLSSMDKVMLRTMCTYDELGLYSAAFKIVSALSIVQSCFTLYWTPLALRWYTEKKNPKNFEVVGNSVAYIMSGLCLGVLLCKDLVALILGDSFVKAIYIFPFLVLYPIFYTISETTGIGISFKRKTEYNIIVSGIAGVSNIVLNYMLIPIYGSVGAAIATGLSYWLFFWGRTYFSRKLWHKLAVKNYVVLSIIVIINCCAHTFLRGAVAYITSGLSLVTVILFGVIYMKKNNIKGILEDA